MADPERKHALPSGGKDEDTTPIPTFPKFADLDQITAAYVLYLNFSIDTIQIFKHIQLDECDLPEPERNGYIKKTKITVRDGCDGVIDATHGNGFRGPNIRPKKSGVLCPQRATHSSKPEQTKPPARGGRAPAEYSMREEVIQGEGDISRVHYRCSECRVLIDPVVSPRGMPSFKNQLALNTSVNGRVVHCMCFKDSIKITGCKSPEDCERTFRLIWKKISVIPGAYTLKSDAALPSAVARKTMQNFGYKFGLTIDRIKLARVLNLPQYSDRITLAMCETTSQAYVYVSLTVAKGQTPNYKKFTVMNAPSVLENQEPPEPELVTSQVSTYGRTTPTSDRNTFMIFPSANALFTGKGVMMEEDMQFINEIIFRHRHEIFEGHPTNPAPGAGRAFLESILEE